MSYDGIGIRNKLILYKQSCFDAYAGEFARTLHVTILYFFRLALPQNRIS